MNPPQEDTGTTRHHIHGYCPVCGSIMRPDGGPDGLPSCPNCDYVRYTNPKVGTGVVAERDGRILLTKRNHDPMMGKWTFPSGFVDAGEVVESAAVREALEETGVEVRIDSLLGVYSTAGDAVVFIAYAGTITAGEPTAGDESDEVALFAPDALPELAFAHDARIVADWRARTGR